MPDRFEAELLRLLDERGEATLAELVDQFPRIKGTTPMVVPYTKIIMWPDLVDWAIDTITRLGGQEKLFIAVVERDAYPRDRWLRWEVAKAGRHYETPRWLPVTLRRERPVAQSKKLWDYMGR